MTFPSLIVVLFIFLLTGLMLLRPFFYLQERETGPAGLSDEDSLLAEKERLLSAIEELDLDYELRRISGEAHARDRNQLILQAAEVLRQLDSLGVSGEQSAPPGDDELENYIAAGWDKLKNGENPVCGNCGSPAAREDRFCRQCGEKL